MVSIKDLIEKDTNGFENINFEGGFYAELE